MIKRISKILVLVILLFSVGISRVFASNIIFRRPYILIEDLKTAGLIETNWRPQSAGTTYMCAGNPGSTSLADSSKCHEVYPNWFFYYIEKDNKYYILYCLNLSKGIIEDHDMVEYDGLDNVRGINDEKKELLKKLLLFGFNPNTPENINNPIEDVISASPEIQPRLIAMQILVWEIMEGGRTSFNSIEPAWHGESSFYERVVKPNGGSNPTKEGTIYYYYKTYVEAARNADQDKPATAFDQENYTMKWNNNKYTVTISGIGNYTNCSVPAGSGVSISVSNGKITASTTKVVSNVKITCKYRRGNGSENEESGEHFKYYKFNVTDDTGYQDMILGSGWKIFSKSLKVSSETTKVKITKTGLDGTSMANGSAEFKLTHQSTGKSVTIGNGSTKSIDYSGEYYVEETKVPTGYKKIDNFKITINAETNKVTKCDNSSKTGNDITSCLNGKVEIFYNNDVIELKIKNESKNIKIEKVDSSGKVINGTVDFEIRNSSNKVVKFTKVGNEYKYDTAGTITSLKDASSYTLSLMPNGNYKIIEIKAPDNYLLPKDEKLRTTNIEVKDGVIMPLSSTTIKIKNYQTKVTIHKIGNGNPLEGVEFELYNEDKTVLLKCNPVQNKPGIYNYVLNQDDANTSTFVTNSSGNITINYLPEGTYWLKETRTLLEYELPQGDSAYTKIEIGFDSNGVSVNKKYNTSTIEISNTPFSFNFYKRDTEGNALMTGEYKLQRYDEETKKYVDLRLVKVENDGTYNPNTTIYKEDEKNGKIIFTLPNGVATFINMKKSTTYRIIETKAPAGYTKASTKDSATVHLDENGYASGTLILVDQKILKEDDSAYAELIINIQTGKERIMYGAVIFVVIAAIAGLILYNRKK